MKATDKQLQFRWVGAVTASLEEVGLFPGAPRYRLGGLLEPDPQVRATEIVVQGLMTPKDTLGVLTVNGHFEAGRFSTFIFCAASESQDTDTWLGAPRLRGHWRIPLECLIEALQETLLEREAVLGYLKDNKEAPFRFSRREACVAVWK